MQGNILLCYPVILNLQVILASNVISVSAFHVQGNTLVFYRLSLQYYSLVTSLLPVQLQLEECGTPVDTKLCKL